MKKSKRLLFFYILIAILGSTGNAAIIYSGTQELIIFQDSNDELFMNMGGASDSFRIRDERGGFDVMRQPVAPIGGVSYSTQVDPNHTKVKGLERGATIQSIADWSSIGGFLLLAYDQENPRFGMGDFFGADEMFMALRILDNEDELFGWVRMSHSLADEQLIIHDWAWNSVPGEPILAGEIPEPGTVALLAGIAALAAAGGRRILRKRSMHTA